MGRESLSTAVAKSRLWFLVCLGMGCVLAGCGDGVRKPSAEEMAVFKTDEATGPAVDMDRVLQAKIVTGPYHTGIGDVLQLEMPAVLTSQNLDGAVADGKKETCACRIGDDGTIMLPVAGPFAAAGKSLAEIEAGVLAQYHPKYIKAPCPIYASVLQYNMRRVSIVGAVARPGVYSLRPDQMSLVALLMEAGGIVERGAALIRIARRQPGGMQASETQAPALLHGADGQPAIRQVQTTLADQAGDTGVRATLQVTFEREGPLRTTGWLAIADQNETMVRRWCDLAAQAQMSAFVDAATATSSRLPVADLRMKVARLARALDAAPMQSQAAAVAQDCGWTVEGTRFVIPLVAPSIKKQIPSGRSTPAGSIQLVNDQAVTTLVLPVKGLNIPFNDVTLQEGDTVTVEWPRELLISVLGLVRNPGNFPYPPNAEYNLIQALGFAGGLDPVADPRYVSIYRLQPDGQIASMTVQLVNTKNEQDLTEALAMPVRPGDVISVEHTLRTRTNVFFDRFFRLTFGLYADPRDLWDDDD